MAPNWTHSKIDANHPELRKCARSAGYAWIDTHRHGDGTIDALVCSKSGYWIPLEIKDAGGELTEKERSVHERCRALDAPIYVVRSWDELGALLQLYDALPSRRSIATAGDAFCTLHGSYDPRDEEGNCPICLAIAADYCAGAY